MLTFTKIKGYHSKWLFSLGWNAHLEGVDFDPHASKAWQNGWIARDEYTECCFIPRELP